MELTLRRKRPQIPPWIVKIPNIDTSLTLEMSKHDEPVILGAIANEKSRNIDAVTKFTSTLMPHVRTTAGKYTSTQAVRD